jgi:hypothetical protein
MNAKCLAVIDKIFYYYLWGFTTRPITQIHHPGTRPSEDLTKRPGALARPQEVSQANIIVFTI